MQTKISAHESDSHQGFWSIPSKAYFSALNFATIPTYMYLHISAVQINLNVICIVIKTWFKLTLVTVTGDVRIRTKSNFTYVINKALSLKRTMIH